MPDCNHLAHRHAEQDFRIIDSNVAFVVEPSPRPSYDLVFPARDTVHLGKRIQYPCVKYYFIYIYVYIYIYIFLYLFTYNSLYLNTLIYLFI